MHMNTSTYRHSKETRAKMKKNHWSRKGKSAWNKGLTKESDSRIKQAGQKLSKTLKDSKARKGSSNPMFGRPSGMKGKKHTQETKQQMSESQKLRWEHRKV